jgi:hypothetical protein
MTSDVAEGASCRANFSGAGRRRRRAISIGLAVFSAVLFAVLVANHASPWARLFLALPAMAAAATGLQVRRNTCVRHATLGTFENDDFSVSKVDEALAEASRRVAKTIVRDGALVGLAVGLIAFASGWVL